MDQYYTITALFVEHSYDLTIDIVGQGTVREERVDTESGSVLNSGQRSDPVAADSSRMVSGHRNSVQSTSMHSAAAAANGSVTVRLTAEPDSGWMFDR